MASFWKPEACGQTVLPDRSVLIGQKLVENAKIQNFKCDILSNFQTMCEGTKGTSGRKHIPDKISKSWLQKQFGKQECEWVLWYEKWHSCHVE